MEVKGQWWGQMRRKINMKETEALFTKTLFLDLHQFELVVKIKTYLVPKRNCNFVTLKRQMETSNIGILLAPVHFRVLLYVLQQGNTFSNLDCLCVGDAILRLVNLHFSQG